MTDTARPRVLRLAFIVIAVVLAAAALAAWLNRRVLVREALSGWLTDRGVASRIEVEDIGLDSLTARLSLGDPARPDFTVQRLTVRYRPQLSGLQIIGVELERPSLRASVKAGKPSLGVLDPLLAEFLRRPPPPGPIPRVDIHGGRLALSTDYGALDIAGDLLAEDGKLSRMTATSAPTHLKGQGFDVAVGAGSFRAARDGARVTATLDAPINAARGGAVQLADGRLTLTAQAPYPDLKTKTASGPVTMRADLFAGKVAQTAGEARAVRVRASFDGRSQGPLDAFNLTGHGSANLDATQAQASQGRSGPIAARIVAEDLKLNRQGGVRVSARIKGEGQLAGLIVGGFEAPTTKARIAGPVSVTADGLDYALVAGLEGRGAVRGLGAPTSDGGQIAAIQRAAQGFTFTAGDMRVDPKGVRLAQPLTVRPDSGGEARLSWSGREARVTVAGGGLPEFDAQLVRIDLAAGAADATLTARAELGPIRSGLARATGRAKLLDGGLVFTATDCAAFSVGRLDFGANDVEGADLKVCPDGGPLLTVGRAGWVVRGRLADGVADIAFAQARVSGGQGRFTASGSAGRIRVDGQLAGARLTDKAPETRFHPLGLGGTFNLLDHIWRSDLGVTQAAGRPLAEIGITHDSRLGSGAAEIQTSGLVFADGGLQPVDLSPLALTLGSPVTGSADFTGRFDWDVEGATSRGVLTIPRLDFQSPAGPVTGLRGRIVLSSLVPPHAAPGQTLEMDEVRAALVLTNLKAQFALSDALVTVEGGEALAGGGRIRIERLDVPFGPEAGAASEGARGALIFEGVQLRDLVEASPFGDRVELDARVSGRVPFEVVAGQVRISGGELKAIQPGRLSIQRAALTGVQADGALKAEGSAPPLAAGSDTFTDFAYQAMEHLAFDTLEATLRSRDNGRLGVLFHIVGRHDPPTPQQIHLSMTDLIRRRFMDRKLPLPSGTGVNLTLDTTLNLDDLLKDYADFQRLRGSGSVQP